jgi:hypothetical protein|tara:strand:- start:2388 stop:3008 length:621 start_codon:yes stop_codon:yes gene_type:complete
MSLETDALDAAALAATNQTIAANDLKDAIDILVTAYAATKTTVDDDLNNVNNTSDADKIISDDVAAALALAVQTSNLATVNGLPLNTGLALLIASSPTSLTSELYDNRNDLRNPVIPQPIAGDALILQYLGLFQFYTSTDEPDDDETCFTANDVDTGLPYGQWLLRVPSYEWTEAHEKIEFRALEEWRDDMDESMKLLLADYNAHH